MTDIANIPMNRTQGSTKLVSRIGWIDVVRGAAIILVVLGHAWRGLWGGGILTDADLFSRVDQAIYLFHMPVFFILAGFVFRKGRRPSPVGFLKSRAVRILYPMLLWFYIFVGVNVLMSSYVNTPLGLDRLLGPPLPFGTHLWFLWALLVIQIICMPLVFLRKSPLAIGFIILAASAGLFFKYGYGFFNIWVQQGITFLPFFLLGALAGETSVHKRLIATKPMHLILCGGGMLFLAEAILFSSASVPAPFLFLGGGAAIGFILMIAGIALLPSLGRFSAGLVLLGSASMAIYLVHIFFTAFTRIALKAVGIQDMWVHVVLGTVLGVIGPIIFLMCAEKLSLRRFFGI